MTNAALKITTTEELGSAHLHLVQKGAVLSGSLEANTSSRSQIMWLAAVLVTLQVLDGILTYAGMSTFGLRAEGNPLLRGLMKLVGVLPAIAITKDACIAVIMTLCAQAHRISWLPVALTCIAGLYAVAAVVPWSWLLLAEYFA
jgi:hypothetical protein